MNRQGQICAQGWAPEDSKACLMRSQRYSGHKGAFVHKSRMATQRQGCRQASDETLT